VALPSTFELVGALKSGDIDASFLWANAVQEALDDPRFVQLADDSDVIDVQSILLIARKDYVEENPETAKKVLQAYVAATEFAQDDPETTAGIVAAGTGGDAATIEAVLPGQNLTMGMTRAQLQHMEDLQAYLVDAGQLQEADDLMQYFDLEPLKELVGDQVEL
jgi:NitT/TauT family transport system substrate-binding protein